MLHRSIWASYHVNSIQQERDELKCGNKHVSYHYLEILPSLWDWLSESHIWRSKLILWACKRRCHFCWSKKTVFEVWMWSGGLEGAQQVGNNTAESCEVGEEGGRRSADQTARRARSRALIGNTRVHQHRSRLMPRLWRLWFSGRRQNRSWGSFPFVQLFW